MVVEKSELCFLSAAELALLIRTRPVTDTALLLQAIAGPDRRDASAATQPVADYQAVLHTDLQAIRIGVPKTFFFDDRDPEETGGLAL